MWIEYEVQPYLIHRNTLHVFDASETLSKIYSDSINLDNISKIKIYMCKSINVYSFYESLADTRSANVPWDKGYEYQIMMLVRLIYCRQYSNNGSYRKFRRITIVANINDSDMNNVVHKAVDSVIGAGYPTPFIERYSGQYIDFPENSTIFSIISDNCRPKTKVLIELTRDSELYMSILPDERCLRYITERHLPIVADIYFNGMRLASGNGTIVVEDYCKWYSLYRVHRNDNNELTVTSFDKIDEIIRDMDIEWCDHCPIPSSVVAQCKKHGVKLGYMSYLTMLCRFEEDVVDKLVSEHISPKEDLSEVLVWDGGSCEYYGMAKLFSVARKFDIKCYSIDQTISAAIGDVISQQNNNRNDLFEDLRKMSIEIPAGLPSLFDLEKDSIYNKLAPPSHFAIKHITESLSETTDTSNPENDAGTAIPRINIKNAYKQLMYDSVIMCPNCLHSEPVSITQTIRIQTKGVVSIDRIVTDVQMYRDDISMTCPECGSTTPSAPLIDAEIYPTIKILNEKGYYTDFCCSGHYDEYTGGTSYAYISFGPVSKMAERSGIYDNISDNIPDTWYIDMMDYFDTGARSHVIRVRDEVQDTDPDKNYLKDILNWAKQLPNLKE